MNKERILAVEDEPDILEIVRYSLAKEGYQVSGVTDGEEALKDLARALPDLVVLDLMLPGVDGLEICRRIRKDRNIPILILSAKSTDMDKILGLTTGADDYLAKPFNVLELLARVKSLLRRSLVFNADVPPGGGEKQIKSGGLTMDRNSRTVKVDGRDVHLTATEFDILYLLAGHPGRVFGAEEIFRTVWADRYYDSNNTVMVHIRKIREKIEDNPGRPLRIRTVWGVGYKYEP